MDALRLTGADERVRTADLLITNQHPARTAQVAPATKPSRINTSHFTPTTQLVNSICKVPRVGTQSHVLSGTKVKHSHLGKGVA